MKMEQQEKHKDKLKSEKMLRQKIESLESEVHSYEMKDVNVHEKDQTIKKILEANRQLREDLKRESERYSLLEGKYKDLLIKYNMLAKENAKNVEMLFTMNTGGNIHNYSNYLNKDEKPEQQKKSSMKKPDLSYDTDKNFEDVF